MKFPQRTAGRCTATILMIVSTSTANAQQDAGRGAELQRPVVTSNQSVSLLDDTASHTAASVRDPLQEASGFVGPPESEAPPAAAAPLEPARPVKRGRPTASGLTDPARPEDTPWYRTGFGALMIVLSVIAAAFVVTRRWIPAAASGDSAALKVVARAAVTPKHSVALLQLGRRFVLIGLSSENVSVLSEISESEEAAEMALKVLSGGPAKTRRFDERLSAENTGFRADDTSLHGDPSVSASRGNGRSTALGELLQRVRSFQGRNGKQRTAT